MKRFWAVLCVAAMMLLCFACGDTAPESSTPEATTTVTTDTTAAPTEGTTEGTESTDGTQPTEGTTAAPTAAVTTTVTTTAKPTTTAAPTTTKKTWEEYNTVQLIPDPDFKNGFMVLDWLSGKDVDLWEPAGLTQDETVWQIAQWGTKKCLIGDRLDTKDTILTDGYKTLTYNKKAKSLALRMDSYEMLGNNKYDSTSGYTWPHLLIQTSPFGYKKGNSTADFYTGKADALIFSLDMRLTEYKNTNYGGPNNCQFVAFFYIHNVKGTGGFLWFGVPLFEARDLWAQTSPYYALDVASNCYIYTLPFNAAYNSFSLGDNFHDESGTPVTSDEWNHYEIDLKPWFEKAANRAIADGFFPGAESVEDLYIDGMNLGYEMGSCFDIEIEFKNMRLDSYIKN